MTPISFIKTFLESEDKIIDGYKYHFDNIHEKPKDGGLIYFDVYVSLPKKGQSYTMTKIIDDVNLIMGNLSKYFGENIAFSPQILIDDEFFFGKDNNVYVSPEKKLSIIEMLNNNYQNMYFQNWGDKYSMRFYFLNPEKVNNNFKMFEQPYIDSNISVNLFIKVFDIKKIISEKETIDLIPDPKKLDDLSSAIWHLLVEKNVDEISNFIESILEDEMNINDSSLFFDINFKIYQIDGIDVFTSYAPTTFDDTLFIS